MTINELKGKIRSTRYYGWQDDLQWLKWQDSIPASYHPQSQWAVIFNRLNIAEIDTEDSESDHDLP